MLPLPSLRYGMNTPFMQRSPMPDPFQLALEPLRYMSPKPSRFQLAIYMW